MLLQSAHLLAVADDPAAAPAILRAALAVAHSPESGPARQPPDGQPHQLEPILAHFAFAAADASARAAQRTLLRTAAAVQGRLLPPDHTAEAPRAPAVAAPAAAEAEVACAEGLLSLPPNELLVECVKSQLATPSGGGGGGDVSEARTALDSGAEDDEAIVTAFAAAAGGGCEWREPEEGMGVDGGGGGASTSASASGDLCGGGGSSATGAGGVGGGGSAATGGADIALGSPVCATLRACVGRVLVSAPRCVRADGLDLRDDTAEGQQLRRLLHAYGFTMAGALAERAREMARDVATAVASASEPTPAKGRLSVAAMDADTSDEDDD